MLSFVFWQPRDSTKAGCPDPGSFFGLSVLLGEGRPFAEPGATENLLNKPPKRLGPRSFEPPDFVPRSGVLIHPAIQAVIPPLMLWLDRVQQNLLT